MPQGHEIVRIDFTPEFDDNGNFTGWDADETSIATQLGTPCHYAFLQTEICIMQPLAVAEPKSFVEI